MIDQRRPFRVPRARLEATHRALHAAFMAALEPLLTGPPEAGYLVREALEREWAAAVEQPFACAVHSATIGLVVALRACGVGPGSEVITVANGDISSIAAIRHCGATPVLCDVLADDHTIDAGLVEPLIGARTRALLPVDLYGHPADVRALRGLADAYGLAVVEDASLAAGARDYGRPVGAWADVTVYSFAPYKPLGSLGNGGMVASADEELARAVRLLSGYGHIPDQPASRPGQQHYIGEGFNVPLDPFEAALLRVKLPRLEDWTRRRRALATSYAAALGQAQVQLPRFRPESEPTFRCYTVRVARQESVYAALRRAGVEAVLHYTPPMHRQPVYAAGLPGADALAVTEQLAGELVCLPLAPDLDEQDVAYVAAVLRAATVATEDQPCSANRP